MNELDYLNVEEEKILNIKERKNQALNDLYTYIEYELSKNYYNYVDLLNNKKSIIQAFLEKYNITDDNDILYIYTKYDSFYRRLKNQAKELHKLKMQGLTVTVEVVLWLIFFGFLGIILFN